MRVIRFIRLVIKVSFMAIIGKLVVVLIATVASIMTVIWETVKKIGVAFIFLFYGIKASLYMGYKQYIDNIKSIWRQLFPK